MITVRRRKKRRRKENIYSFNIKELDTEQIAWRYGKYLDRHSEEGDTRKRDNKVVRNKLAYRRSWV